MPSRRSTPTNLPPTDEAATEIARSAARQRELRVTRFDADLMLVAERFMLRRGSRTLDATDVDRAHAWLTRPPRKAVVRDAIASVMVFLAAGVMAYGINGLSADPPVKGGWLFVVASIAFGLFAELFRRWDYE